VKLHHINPGDLAKSSESLWQPPRTMLGFSFVLDLFYWDARWVHDCGIDLCFVFCQWKPDRYARINLLD